MGIWDTFNVEFGTYSMGSTGDPIEPIESHSKNINVTQWDLMGIFSRANAWLKHPRTSQNTLPRGVASLDSLETRPLIHV